jgi:UDP-N-acetylmuramyl pentapeptide synthase
MVSFTRAQMAHEDFSLVLIKYKYKVVDLASDAVSFTKEQLLDYNIETVIKSNFAELIALCPFRDPVSIQNLTLVLGVVSYFIPALEDVQSLVEKLPRLAMRMETFEGINNTTIINDAYNLDLDALEQSLEFQKSISGSTKRIAILSLDYLTEEKKLKIHQLIASFSLNEVLYVTGNEIPTIDHISNATVLIKGSRSAQMQRVAGLFYLKKHDSICPKNKSEKNRKYRGLLSIKNLRCIYVCI